MKSENLRYDFLRGMRRIIYNHNSNVSDLESFQDGLRKRYHISSITRSSWIASRNLQTKPFVIKFIRDHCPEYVKIPGELLITKVYQYKDGTTAMPQMSTI